MTITTRATLPLSPLTDRELVVRHEEALMSCGRRCVSVMRDGLAPGEFRADDLAVLRGLATEANALLNAREARLSDEPTGSVAS